ncbi:MAG: histidine phosphatase family protein [Halobacteriovoraceae bacterium]|jgi:uncharacterized phosphatase|nr:histidine phosphatase family protein [Halobacteriovoraceae bacterium]
MSLLVSSGKKKVYSTLCLFSDKDLYMELVKNSFFFIRHGETDWNVEGKFQGQTDIPLNNVGLDQAQRSAKVISSLGIDAVFTSPLKRALETARIVTSSLDIDIIAEPLLMECSTEETAKVIYMELAVSNLPSFNYINEKNVEDPDTFITRTLAGVNNSLKSNANNILIVAHGGTFWAICKRLNIKPFSVPNAQPLRIYLAENKMWKYEMIWQ